MALIAVTSAFGQTQVTEGVQYVPKSQAEIDAIADPSEGRHEYNKDTQTYWFYNGSYWVDSGIGGSSTPGMTEAAVEAYLIEEGYVKGPIPGNSDDQQISLLNDNLSIEDGNSVSLTKYLDDTTLSATQVDSIVDAAGYVSGPHTVDTKLNESEVDAFVSNNGYSTGPHTTDTDDQILSFDNPYVLISEGNAIDISAVDTQLTEAEVDHYVSNNGYTIGPHTTNTDEQTLTLDAQDSLKISNGNAVSLAKYLGGSSQTLTLEAAQDSLRISDGNAVSLGKYLDDTDTVLSEEQVDAYVSNNNYSTGAHTVDTDTHADQAEIEGMGFVTGPHTTDTDTDDQTLSFANPNLTISEGNTVDLSALDTDTVLSEAEVDAYVNNNGYSTGAHTTDTKLTKPEIEGMGFVDGPHTTDTKLSKPEIEAMGFHDGPHTVDTDTQLSKADILAMDFHDGPHTTDTNTQLSEAQVDSYVANNGYSTGAHTVDTDTDEQTLSFTTPNLSISNGNSVDLSELDTDTVLSEAQVDSYVSNNGYSQGAHTTDTTRSDEEIEDVTGGMVVAAEDGLAYSDINGTLSVVDSELVIMENQIPDLQHTVDTDTQLSEAEVDAYVANNGYSTGAHTTDTDTQLSEAEVDAYVSNNGYSLGDHVSDYVDLSSNQTVGGEKIFSGAKIEIQNRLAVGAEAYGPNRIGDSNLQAPSIDTKSMNFKDNAQNTVAAVFLNPDGTQMTIKGFDDSVQVTAFTGLPADQTDPNRSVESTNALVNDYQDGSHTIFDVFNQDYPNGVSPEVRVAQGFVAINRDGAAAKKIGMWRYDGTNYTTIWETGTDNATEYTMPLRVPEPSIGSDATTKTYVDAQIASVPGPDGTGTDDQQISLLGDNLSIEDGNTISLSKYMDDTDTVLSEAQVDAYADNNGYSLGAHTVDTDTQLSEAEVDAYVANNGYSTGSHTVDTDTDEQTLSLVSNTLSIVRGNSVDLSPYLDNTDTQLTESEVDAYVANNGYSTGSHTVNTDDQTLTLTGDDLSIESGNSVSLSKYMDDTDTVLSEAEVDAYVANNNYSTGAHTVDTDTDDQTISLTGDNLSISEGNTISLAKYMDDTDTVLSEAEVDAYVANNNYSTGSHTVDTDTDDQTLSLTGDDLAISEGNSVNLSKYLDDTDTVLTEAQVDAYADNNGYSMGAHTVDTDTQLSEAEVDAYVANNGYSTGSHTVDTDDQTLSFTSPNLTIAGGNTVDISAIDTDTQLSEAQVDSYVANNGYSTGAHTVDTDTQLSEAEVDAYVANNGYSTGAHTVNTDDQTASEVSFDNTATGYTATNVQDAIDEMDTNLDDVAFKSIPNVFTADNQFEGNLNIRANSGGYGFHFKHYDNTWGEDMSFRWSAGATADANEEFYISPGTGKSELKYRYDTDTWYVDYTPLSTGDHTTNTDSQTLSFASPNLTISGGNSVDLSAIDTDTQLSEAQVDSYVANNGYSTGAHTVNTDSQTLSLDGTNLTITGGNTIGLSSIDTNLSEAEVDAYVANNGYPLLSGTNTWTGLNTFNMRVDGDKFGFTPKGTAGTLTASKAYLWYSNVDRWVFANDGYTAAAELDISNLTTSRVFTLPDKSGTLATVDDVAGGGSDDQLLSTTGAEGNITIEDGNTLNLNVGWTASNDGNGSGLDADLLDGLGSSNFLRSDTDDTFAGNNLTIENTIRWDVSDTNNAGQKIDARAEGTDEARLHFHGFTKDTGAASAYKAAFYDGSTYTDINAESGGLSYWGKFRLYSYGDAALTIDADRDNVTEEDHPHLHFKQDGGANHWAIGTGFSDVEDSNYSNHIVIDAKTDQALYYRRSGSIYKIWSQYNDGSGSYLDADLFDGKNSDDFVSSEYDLMSSAGKFQNMANMRYWAESNSNNNLSGTLPSTYGQLYMLGGAANGRGLSFYRSKDSSIFYAGLEDSAGNMTYSQVHLGGDNTSHQNITMTGYLTSPAVSSRDKLRVWTSSEYAIGMDNVYHHGELADYAMTFNMSNSPDRGFWWGDTSHTKSQAAMSLSTQGYLAVSNHAKFGYGESDTADVSKTYTVAANGTMYATDFILSSDRRFKKNISTLNERDWAGDIRFVEYERKDTPGVKRYGVIAQEVEKNYPELVTEDEGYKAVSYTDLLILKMAEKDAQIEELQDDVEELKAMVEMLMKEKL